MNKSLSLLDAFILLLVTFIWGSNFVVIRIALDEFEPMLLALIRFVLAALPLIFFIPRPAIETKYLALNGLMIGAGQFGLLYWAIQSDITPGMASLLKQTQVFFTIVLASLVFHEAVTVRQRFGLALGALGLVAVGFHIDKSITALGLLLIICGAACWAISNTITKLVSNRTNVKPSMFAFIVWSSLYAIPPLLILTLTVVGPSKAWSQLVNASIPSWSAAIWQTVGNTLIGFALWAKLLTKYPASIVAPWALLVPIFGLSSAAWLLNEPFPVWKMIVSLMIMAGVAIASWPSKKL
jgi:O-acetylserine/cysteine efflux transporter